MNIYTINQPFQRLEYIDIAKGIGMILVVIGHCINGKVFPGTWINSFHMPLFFILSGLCFNEKKYPVFLPFLEKRIKTLLLPCLYFSIAITFLSTLFFEDYTPTKLLHGFPGGLWFVFILFLCELIYWSISRIPSKLLQCVLLTLSLFIGLSLNRLHIQLPYSLCSVFAATFFYGFGHLSKNKIKSITDKKHLPFPYSILLAAAFILAPGVTVFFTKAFFSMSSNSIPKPELIYCLLAIMGAYGTLILSTLHIGKNLKRPILFIGNNTLTILGTHLFFITFVSQYVHPLIHNGMIYKIIEQNHSLDSRSNLLSHYKPKGKMDAGEKLNIKSWKQIIAHFMSNQSRTEVD